ncbi:MAG: response regulator [Halobacteriales archaeon]
MQRAVDSAGEGGTTASPIRVLLVEDDPLLSEVSAAYLERIHDDLEVETETRPLDALERIEADAFDCIVSDYVMPGMNGLELLEAVRDRDEDVPFIMLTGKGDEHVASEALATGATDYLPKERNTDQYESLAERIAAAVAGRRDRTVDGTYRALLEAAHVEALVLEADGTVAWTSPALDEAIDADVGALRDASVFTLVHPEDVAAFREAFFALVDGDAGSFSLDVRVGDPTEGWTWMEARGIDRVDLDGIGGYAVFLQDVSDRKAAEHELKERVDHLDAFASLVSHDLRNPLSIARGRLDLAMDECDSPHLADVATAHDRIDALLDDLLEFARVGQAAIEPEVVELAPLVRDCWEDLRPAGATLQVETDRTVRADPDRLRQLFENLLDNALDHAGPGVTVTVGELDDGFFVADDGPGIPESSRDRVFDPGYSEATDGVGFGLAIVRRLAEAHGWDVAVRDADPTGARFEITGVAVD